MPKADIAPNAYNISIEKHQQGPTIHERFEQKLKQEVGPADYSVKYDQVKPKSPQFTLSQRQRDLAKSANLDKPGPGQYQES